MITSPGEYVTTPRAAPVACPVGKYCPGNSKVYYSDTRYKPATWIQSDGSAYINTGIVTRPEYDYTIITTLDGTIEGESRCLFGARADWYDSARCEFMTATTEGKMRYDRFGYNSWLVPAEFNFINDGDFHTLSTLSSGELYVDGIMIKRNTPNTNIGNYNVAMFAVNTGGTIELIDNVNKISTYTVTDSNTGNMVQNMIAAYDTLDGVFGMYDSVSAVFYGNAGTGRFIGELADDDNTDAGIIACPDGYTDNPEPGAIEITQCQTSCSGGSYVMSANDKCVSVGAGNYCKAHMVNYGEVSPTEFVQTCPTGLTTIGYGTGADEVGDCGRVLHIGNDYSLRLRSEKRTERALGVKFHDGTVLYGDMTPGHAHGYMRTKIGTQVYSIYNADLE